MHTSQKERLYFQQETLRVIEVHEVKFVLHAAQQRLPFFWLNIPRYY